MRESELPVFGAIDLIAAPLIGRVERIDKKHVECEHVVEETKLEAVVDETERAPHAHDLVAQEALFHSIVVFVRPESNVNV